MCQKKVGWDVPIDDDVKKKLFRWEQELPDHVSTTRSLVKFQEEIESIELHAFADASGDGVSSTVYAIVRQPSGVSQGLVAARSRLAKQGLTIPRLELVSAHMAANLVSNFEKDFPSRSCRDGSTALLRFIGSMAGENINSSLRTESARLSQTFDFIGVTFQPKITQPT
jgi:hypothetical protein